MNVFDRYARYYDLLYRDKDYLSDAEFVRDTMRRHGSRPRCVLELGSGTGRHALVLAELGFEVLGVDQSPRMVAEADRRRGQRRRQNVRGNVEFREGDARSVRIEKSFDAVVSLFHVISYQVTNDDLLATFATARHHLVPGGLFIFDGWYGPAVLSQRPEVRIKRVEDAETQVYRSAEPNHIPDKNRVDVHYEVFITDKKSGDRERFKEVHSMRYLFRPELELMLGLCGFELVESAEWLTGRPLSESTWNACFVARALDTESED